MLRRIWQWIVSLFQGLFGTRQKQTLPQVPKQPPKPLTEADYEYLFMQLLEGVAHGWQQARVLKFFDATKNRIAKEQWLAWLRGFGERLLASPVPNNELAARMVRLGELDCGEIGNVALDIGMQLLVRQPGRPDTASATQNFHPVYEYSEEENYDETLPENDREDPELKQVTLDELLVMLQQDPGFLEQVAQQLQIETTDPQVIIEALVEQLHTGELPVAPNAEQDTASATQNFHPVYEYSEEENYDETLPENGHEDPELKQVTLDELLVMLQQDPGFLEQVAQQLQIETTDPQVIIEALIGQFNTAIQGPADEAEASLNQGEEQVRAGDLSGAIASYDKAIEFKPDYSEAWYGRGNALVNLRRLEEAIASYDKAIEFKPDFHQAWYGRGEALRDLGRLEEANASFESAVEFKSNQDEA